MESEESEKSEEKNKCEINEGNTGCENHVEGKVEENVKEEKKFSKKREVCCIFVKYRHTHLS